MQNENITENIEVSGETSPVLDSSSGDEVTAPTAPEETTETETTETETEMEDGAETVPETETETVPETEAETVPETETETVPETAEEELNSEIVVYDYTESLMLIDEHLQLVSARIEYCNCLLIIILLIILLQYVYKFFKLFF